MLRARALLACSSLLGTLARADEIVPSEASEGGHRTEVLIVIALLGAIGIAAVVVLRRKRAKAE